MTKILWIYLIGVNIVAFFLYGIDKRRAIKDRWRIPESTLLGIALVGGSVGAWAGMQMFRHKTKHWYFVVVNIFAIILHTVIAFYLFQPKQF